MSVEAISKVLNHSKAKGSQKLVLIGIANHHGDEGAWPAISTLARYANLSERRVQQMIRELEEMGELRIEKNKGGGYRQYKTNRYWILTEEKSGVKPASVRGEAGFVSGVKPVSPETSIETKENPLKEFEIFWKQYPRSENKSMAEKAFVKARKKASLELLLKRLEQYKYHNNKNDIKFAYAATWLNQERWMDEYQIQTTKPDRSREQTVEMLKEYEQLEKNKGPAPKCEHGNNIALCRECFGQK